MEKIKWNPSKYKFFEDQIFKSIDFSNSSLNDYSFTECKFNNCNFMENDCRNTIFSNCIFNNCILSLVKLEGSRLQDIEFIACKITGLDFFKCDHKILFSIKANDCFFQYCNFSDISMNKTVLKNSKIHKCSFTNTSLKESNFTNCDLIETTFHNCNLSKTNFCGAKNYNINPITNNLKKAKFSFPEVVNLLNELGIEII